MESNVLSAVLAERKAGRRSYWVLLDPDDFSLEAGSTVACEAERCGVNALLIGGSLIRSNGFDEFVQHIKSSVSIPVLLFPGDATQLSSHADAILYLSLISGRNPVNLIGQLQSI